VEATTTTRRGRRCSASERGLITPFSREHILQKDKDLTCRRPMFIAIKMSRLNEQCYHDRRVHTMLELCGCA